ncbi:Peptidase S33 tripeptidyl aminopeptidase-lik [Metarhizium album ARSEF 1941]|uniref:Peptidase S33 tripeptidyl aminopeptidase-lik n=1 Tax=Metarhizium album (strain ARSEF 1941) TaxID=1081103 RepID=A0A0B2WH33_METAS|nr:Peptidase S33 tripeptidyl aminopeptidase-lik [Metarhizium album ARSEF 1941]KHN95296.1 Peptidase S33 tripeptidyl aminopeptidase-lik [Metarhizium album ARSEF 1941]
MTVPLDYTDKTGNATLELQLQRAPAQQKSKTTKSILLNFGGPGADGIEDFAYFAQRMQAATGGGHHLINVVPRGTGETLPFSCFSNDVLRTASNQALAGNASNVALGYVWERAGFFASDCHAAQNKTGNLVGTAFVARDMMEIVDALGEDGMLRFWGVSYGSILGSTAAAMFPDKIDKMILDGVANPFEYYENRHVFTETELFSDSDNVIKGFVEGCVANPKACPLAKNQTAAQLEESIYQLFQKLKYELIGIPVPGYPGGGLLIDYSFMSAVIFRQLYTPSIWQSTAKCILALMTGQNTSPGLQHCVPGLAQTASKDASGKRDQEAQFGIKCSDVRVHTKSLTPQVLPVLQERHNKSRFFGDHADTVLAKCAQWTLPAKERYMGDFNVRTKKPLLIIGNTHDPVTPLVSARNVSETFKGSVLLQHDSYGHASLMQASLCTAKAIRSYIVNGTMPGKGTKCDVKVPLFSGKDGWDEVMEQLKKSQAY